MATTSKEGSRRANYPLSARGNFQSVRKDTKRNPIGQWDVKVKMNVYKHQDGNFEKKVFCMARPDGSLLKTYAAVSYYWNGEITAISPGKHGNARKEGKLAEYQRTRPSIIRKIRLAAISKTPRRIMADFGGDFSRSPAERPRNMRQIYNQMKKDSRLANQEENAEESGEDYTTANFLDVVNEGGKFEPMGEFVWASEGGSQQTFTESIPNWGRKRKVDVLQTSSPLYRVTQYLQPKKRRDEDDEDEKFVWMLAKDMRILSPTAKRRLKLALYQLVFDAVEKEAYIMQK